MSKSKVLVANVPARSPYYNETFSRALAPDEVVRLTREPVHGNGLVSVADALQMRKLVMVEVVLDEQDNTIAVAQGPRGVIVQMGVSPFDAVQRLVSAALRP